MKQIRMETSRKQAILCELSKAPRYLQKGQILRVPCVPWRKSHSVPCYKVREGSEREREPTPTPPPTHPQRSSLKNRQNNSKPHLRLQYEKASGWGWPIPKAGWETALALNSLGWGWGANPTHWHHHKVPFATNGSGGLPSLILAVV